MLFDGLRIVGSATIDNLNVQHGSSLPVSGNNTGELFYLTTGSTGLYVFDGAIGAWPSAGTLVGKISITGSATTYATSSDERMKKNIENAGSALDILGSITVRQFDWRTTNEHTPFGFVAQELVQHVPAAVAVPENPDEMMGVDMSKLVPILTKALQEALAEIEALKMRLSAANL